jgi:putative effector of murein hydrolase LrgA (UPF0299 family)
MLNALTLIFCCQLIGELFVKAAGLPIPGPVFGMVLLFTGLVIRGGVPSTVGAVSDFLLRHLSLLFVPAGVGVMLHVRLLEAEAIPITAALLGSTLLTISITALLMQWLNRRMRDINDKTESSP